MLRVTSVQVDDRPASDRTVESFRAGSPCDVVTEWVSGCGTSQSLGSKLAQHTRAGSNSVAREHGLEPSGLTPRHNLIPAPQTRRSAPVIVMSTFSATDTKPRRRLQRTCLTTDTSTTSCAASVSFCNDLMLASVLGHLDSLRIPFSLRSCVDLSRHSTTAGCCADCARLVISS